MSKDGVQRVVAVILAMTILIGIPIYTGVEWTWWVSGLAAVIILLYLEPNDK